MICFTDFTLQIYQSNRFIRNSLSNANCSALKRFIKLYIADRIILKIELKKIFRLKQRRWKMSKVAQFSVCQACMQTIIFWFAKGNCLFINNDTTNLQETYSTHSTQNYWRIHARSDMIWNIRKEFSVFVARGKQTFQNRGRQGGLRGEQGADWDSKWRLSIYLCTKCNFIWGQGGQSFCQRGSRPPPPPSLATPLVCSLCRKQTWHYFVDNSLKL